MFILTDYPSRTPEFNTGFLLWSVLFKFLVFCVMYFFLVCLSASRVLHDQYCRCLWIVHPILDSIFSMFLSRLFHSQHVADRSMQSSTLITRYCLFISYKTADYITFREKKNYQFITFLYCIFFLSQNLFSLVMYLLIGVIHLHVKLQQFQFSVWCYVFVFVLCIVLPLLPMFLVCPFSAVYSVL